MHAVPGKWERCVTDPGRAWIFAIDNCVPFLDILDCWRGKIVDVERIVEDVIAYLAREIE